MNVADDAVAEIVGAMWAEFLRMPGELVRAGEPSADRTVALATVTITGPSVTVVEVACSPDLASQIAVSVFGVETAVGEAEIADVVKELANVVGGSVKAASPGPATMSVPTFALVARHRCPCLATPVCQAWRWTAPSGGTLSIAVLIRGGGHVDDPGVSS